MFSSRGISVCIKVHNVWGHHGDFEPGKAKEVNRTCNLLPFSCTHLALWRSKEEGLKLWLFIWEERKLDFTKGVSLFQLKGMYEVTKKGAYQKKKITKMKKKIIKLFIFLRNQPCRFTAEQCSSALRQWCLNQSYTYQVL